MRCVKLLFVAPLAALQPATPRVVRRRALRFDPSQANYIRAPGRGVIAGQAFLRDGSGHRMCATPPAKP